MCFWTFFFLSSRSWLFFPLSLPFYVSLFLEDSVWFDHRFSFLFYFLLLHTLLIHKTPCFFELFPFARSHPKKMFFLFVGPLKKRNVPLCFLFLFFSSQEKLQNDNLFYLFLTFFFELFTFFNTDSVGKTSCFLFFGLFLFSVFLSSVFHVVFCLIFLDLLRNMLPFQSVFFTSLFPLFVHPLSICSLFFCLLLFSRFFHLFSLFKLLFYLFIFFMFLYVKLFVEKLSF